MDFYTYQYLRQDGTPYYVGKGSGNRVIERHGKNIHVPSRSRALIQHWESEAKAFEMEVWWIKFWGRKDNGTGILRNLTDGGQGSSLSDATKEKISVSKKRNPYSPTAEHRQALSLAHTGKKRSLGYRHTAAWKAAQSQRSLGNHYSPGWPKGKPRNGS